MKQSIKKKQYIKQHPIRNPSKVMTLERLGSFHQTRLSFTRQLVKELTKRKAQFEISQWNLDKNGFGCAVIKTIFNHDIYSLVVFCNPLNDEERSDRVIAEKWDMTFSLFEGVPSESELTQMSQNLIIQEAGRHLPKQLTLSRANKSVRIFNKVLDNLSNGKQPSKTLINEIGYLVRTTAVYGNGKFGIGDFSKNQDKEFLKKPFQAEMLTVYLIRYFSIELINYLAKQKGKSNSVKISDRIAKHIGVGNATGLGMAPFLINHPGLIHKWMLCRETAISRVFSIKELSVDNQNKIIDLIQQACKYTSQWEVNDIIQSKRITKLNLELENIYKNNNLPSLLSKNYPIKNMFEFFVNKISLETEEILQSIFIEPFPELIEDLEKEMGLREINSVPIEYNVSQLIEIIKENYSWALKIDITHSNENHFFWYTSQAKLEPRLGIREIDDGHERQLPFDIPHQVQKALKVLEKLPGDMTGSEAMITNPKIRNIIRRVVINKLYPYSEIQNNLVGKDIRPIDILRCKLSFFGASKYDPKSDLWTRITLFQGAPLPHQLHEKNSCEWLFPVLSNV
ncbi:hypothetical protein OAK51_04025 [Alphaproteobacteria bacterium]|nr:hypothetical protein [Alphaproteobacteria bacterium]